MKFWNFQSHFFVFRGKILTRIGFRNFVSWVMDWLAKIERKQRKERKKERKFKETEKIQTQRERERAEEKVFHGSVAFPLVVDFGQNFLSKKRVCFLWRKISPPRNKLLFRFHFCFRSCLLIYKPSLWVLLAKAQSRGKRINREI